MKASNDKEKRRQINGSNSPVQQDKDSSNSSSHYSNFPSIDHVKENKEGISQILRKNPRIQANQQNRFRPNASQKWETASLLKEIKEFKAVERNQALKNLKVKAGPAFKSPFKLSKAPMTRQIHSVNSRENLMSQTIGNYNLSMALIPTLNTR